MPLSFVSILIHRSQLSNIVSNTNISILKSLFKIVHIEDISQLLHLCSMIEWHGHGVHKSCHLIYG